MPGRGGRIINHSLEDPSSSAGGNRMGAGESARRIGGSGRGKEERALPERVGIMVGAPADMGGNNFPGREEVGAEWRNKKRGHGGLHFLVESKGPGLRQREQKEGVVEVGGSFRLVGTTIISKCVNSWDR